VHSLCCPLSRLCICELARYSQGNFVLVTGKVGEFYIVRPVGTLAIILTALELVSKVRKRILKSLLNGGIDTAVWSRFSEINCLQ